MSKVSQSKRQEQDLTLPASPCSARVEVQDSKTLHSAANLSANALKIPRSHGSGESFISSGCHCTASAHQSSLIDSIASTIPSGARAVTRIPGAMSSTL